MVLFVEERTGRPEIRTEGDTGMLRLTTHPVALRNGQPALTKEQGGLRFRSYAQMANWADQNLQPGLYNIIVNDRTVKDLHFRCGGGWEMGFYVEGRGNIQGKAQEV